jgi:integrase
MPKPYFLHRPSGLFCRFLVPADLQQQAGTRFIVRALNTFDCNYARLLAAILGIAIGNLFTRMRNGEKLDFRNLLSQTRLPQVQHLIIGKVTSPDGHVFEGVQIDSEDDQRLFEQILSARQPRFITMLPAPSVPVAPADNGDLLATRIEQFLSEKERGQLSAKNLADAAFALRGLLLALCDTNEEKPKRLNDVGSDDADKVMVALLNWPSNASKKPAFQGLSAIEIVAKAQLIDAEVIAPRTVEKYLDRLRVFFNWCADRGYLTGRNPFAERRIMRKDKREQTQKKPFSDDDLKAIFAPTLRATCDEPHKFWCPLIALFSAARINEIAQLYVDDLYECGGVWLFNIHAGRPDQKIKNNSSERAVPIHTTLIELGFLDYINDVKSHGFERMFPNLPYSAINGYGDAVSDWFNGRYLRPAAKGSKVKRAGISEREKSFHSFRYVATNRLYRITRENRLVSAITGHDQDTSVLSKIYLDPVEVERRAAIIDQIAYPFLSFSPYQAGQFEGFFKRLRRKQMAK